MEYVLVDNIRAKLANLLSSTYSCHMQLISKPIEPGCVHSCAKEVLDAVPSLFWYVRLQMRKHRQGLSVPQFRGLVKVRNESAVSLSAVADHLGASLPTRSEERRGG